MKKTISSPGYRKLILWLKKGREDRGLSMRALAELLGVPHSFVQKVETLERKLDIMEYVRYCSALGLDPKSGLDVLGG
jgi:transcriptional regulator with XRE-family HTH domain